MGALTIGTTYKLTYTISNYSAGNIVIQAGWQSSGTSRSANGTYTEYLVCAGDTKVAFLGTSSFTGSIDNVSVKEYLGQSVVPDSGCGSWLFEPQSTNLVTQSELLNGYWSNSGSNNLISEVISPDGISFSQKVTTTSAGNFKGLSKNEGTIWDSKTLTISTFAKKGNTDWLYFYNIGSNNGNNGVWFNLDSGLISTIGAAWSNVKIETFQNGWYRCSATLSFGAASNYLYILNSDANNSVFSTLDNYAYIWGTQIEENNISSYIPTSGETVTRNQDVCANGGSLASINSTEGTLYAQIAALANDLTNRTIALSDGTTSNTVRIQYLAVSNAIWATVTNIGAGGNQAVLKYTSPDITINSKVALKFAENDFALWVDGVQIDTDTSGVTFPANTLNTLQFDRGNGTQNFFGKTKALAVWKEALSDQELADLTYPTPTDPTFALDFDTIATDFTFARGSEATYVDAQGLIKSTNELGPELVTNGDFATDTDWVKGTGWSISGGTANCDGTQTSNSNLLQSNTATSGNTYKITYTITNYVSGTFKSVLGAGGVVRNSNGVYSEYITATSSSFLLQANSDFIGSIDNVSVKEYITATNTPRLDYSTGAEAFLLEPQSTNLFTYSESTNNFTALGRLNCSYSLGNGYDGFNSSCKITNNTFTNNKVSAVIIFNSVFGESNFFTLRVKKKQGWYLLASSGNACNPFTLKINLSTNGGFISSFGTSATNYVVQEFSNYYLIGFLTTQSNTTTAGLFNLGFYNNVNFNNYDLTTIEEFNVTGIQWENNQDYATSYIPTSGTSVTRNQETCMNATPEINSEEGVLYAEIASLSNEVTSNYISLSDGTYNNRISLMYSVGTNIIRGF